MAVRGSQGADNKAATFRFVDLPAELRLAVYDYTIAQYIDHLKKNQSARRPPIM